MNTTNPYSPPENFATEAPVATEAEVTARPWGPWATLGWTLVVIFAMALAQAAVVVATVVGLMLMGQLPDAVGLSTNGNLVAGMSLSGAVAMVGLVVALCYLRGVPIADYLALRFPTLQQSAVWLLGLAAYILAADLTTYALGRPVVPPFMTDLYATAWLPLLLVALLLAAPLSEETLVRGFMITGLSRSRCGAPWAVCFSSAVWAAMHLQYGLYEIGLIFILGVFLGAARHITGSLLLAMLLHCVANAVATVEAMIAAA